MYDNVAFVVSSCDKYEDAWYPYFELVKKYWPNHPSEIVLITETKHYTTYGLNIKTYNFPQDYTWSERLYYTLAQLNTKYIIFSLEDFFLFDHVDDLRILRCISWMEQNQKIVQCRLIPSSFSQLTPSRKYEDFCFAGDDVPFRLDTQVAIWNREGFMSFIDLSESPWLFESKGTTRIIGTDKIFLWYQGSAEKKLIFPYRLLFQNPMCGISWGHWLSPTKKLFKDNGINGVRYWRLGVLSEKAVKRRLKHLYNKNPTNFEKLIRPCWLMFAKCRVAVSNVLIFGFKKGMSLNLNKIKSRTDKIKKCQGDTQ